MWWLQRSCLAGYQRPVALMLLKEKVTFWFLKMLFLFLTTYIPSLCYLHAHHTLGMQKAVQDWISFHPPGMCKVCSCIFLYSTHTGSSALCFVPVSYLASSDGQLCDWNTYFKQFIGPSFCCLFALALVTQVIFDWLLPWENGYSEKGCAHVVCECVYE